MGGTTGMQLARWIARTARHLPALWCQTFNIMYELGENFKKIQGAPEK